MQQQKLQHYFPDEISSIKDEPFDDIFKSVENSWPLYTDSYPPKSFDPSKPFQQMIMLFHQASKKPYFSTIFVLLESTPQYYEVGVNYSVIQDKLLNERDEVSLALVDMMNNIQYEGQRIVSALQLILHNLLAKQKNRQKKVNVSIYNYPLTQMIDIKAHMVQNFISIEAIVIKVHQIRLLAQNLEFTCFQCKSTFVHYFTDGIYSVPNRCRGSKKKQCKSKTFVACKDKIKSIFIQRIKVQQVDPQGRVPRQIACELRETQVGKIITGETIIVSGVIKTESSDEKDKKTQGIFTPYLKVNSIKQKKGEGIVQDDLKIVEKMRKDKNIFYSLIRSFCPTIYGHQLVKAGLLLGLIGGSAKNVAQETCFRETSHILLLGDPGIGKSQLLKFAVQILPHSVYVSATSMSHSGLTVTINKQNNQQSLEAGALILADNGICAIDEFDKASDSSSLLEVMEQQNISIAKAGVLCQLKCRVGIVASANPINGCYNKSKSFMENTKISNAILSRFDLIFLLVDKPDPERDRKLTEHIMNIHNKNRKKSAPGSKHLPELNKHYQSHTSLNDKYTQYVEQYGTQYELDEIRKYLHFIKSSVHPTLSKEAADVIKSFYIVLRQNNPTNSFQITNRHLESLVRLSMARARIQCREQVTEEDAYEITQLMQESLFDSFEEMGYNMNALKHESNKVKINKKPGQLSLPKQRNIFINTLADMQKDRLSNIWEWGQLIKVAKDLELNIGDFHNFIERLNQEGVLLQKGSKKYSFEGHFL